MERCIGVDLHKKSFTVCYRSKAGKKEIAEYRVATKGIEDFKSTLRKKDKVAIESTGNTGYLARAIEGCVESIKIINPSQFKVIANSVKKTDKLDAATIAEYLSKGLIPEVRMKSKGDSQLSSLIGTRDKLVKLRTALKNKIHNILNANGIVTRKEMFTSDKSLQKVLELDLDETDLFELRLLVEHILHLNESVKKINKELKGRGSKIKGFKNLNSITGIRDTSATILLSVIGDVNDFENSSKLASYFGIVPRVYASGETVQYGKITKMGNKIGRTTLVQSTWVAIKYNAYLNNYYSRLKAKKGSGKAIIATARKYLDIIYKTLKYDWIFENFNEFKLAETH
jgi:transposase